MDPSPLSTAHCESVLHAEMFKLAPSETMRTAVDKKKSFIGSLGAESFGRVMMSLPQSLLCTQIVYTGLHIVLGVSTTPHFPPRFTEPLKKLWRSLCEHVNL